jgi:exosortase A-associated hydrolase 2
LQPAFIGRDGERIFVLLRMPATPCTQCVLLIPPFAEEMNKSRRMMALVAQELAERGVAVAVLDLYGTGDSDGDFREASWQRWVADVLHAKAWCEEQGMTVVGVIGVRLGCALAIDALGKTLADLRSMVFWQPLFDGGRALDQFLRLRVAAAVMNDTKESAKELRARLLAGETLEVAGYCVSGALARSLTGVRVTPDAPIGSGRVHWIEVARSADTPWPAAATAAVEAMRANGREVVCRQIVGEPFWTSTEIVTLPELVDATVAALAEGT